MFIQKFFLILLEIILVIFPTILLANQYDAKLLQLTNAERQVAGLSPLRLSSELGQAAQAHADDMAHNNYFNHQGLNGSTPAERVTATGYRYSFVGENISSGRKTPEKTVEGWMQSPGHRQNILDPNYTEIGFGYSYTDNSRYQHYWVQVFGSQQGDSQSNHSKRHKERLSERREQPHRPQQSENTRPVEPPLTLAWQTSKSDAMTIAKSQGKYVLLASCGSESYTERTFASPEVQNFIRQHFVPWFSVASRSNENYTGEYSQYMRGVENARFPFVAVIDPATDQVLTEYQFSHAQEQSVVASLQKLIGISLQNLPPQPIIQNPDGSNTPSSLVWKTSKSDAIMTAQKQNKYVLFFGGSNTCGTCQRVRNKIFEEPQVKALLQQSFVLWYSEIDSSGNEFRTYAGGLGNDWGIPLLAIIDPHSPDMYISRNVNRSKTRQEQQLWLQRIYPWLQQSVQ